MPYTVPHTIAAGETVTIATMNSEWAGNVSFLANRPTVKVKNSGSFSHTSSGNWVAITWNQEDYDTAALHDTSSLTSRLIAPIAGKYRIWGYVQWDGNTTGIRALAITHSSGTDLSVDHKTASTTFAGVQCLQVYAEHQMAANEYVEIRGWQDSGGTRTISNAARASMSWFSL